jgi:hypothetical protein
LRLSWVLLPLSAFIESSFGEDAAYGRALNRSNRI